MVYADYDYYFFGPYHGTLDAEGFAIVHHYAGTAKTAVFAERYSASMVKPSSLGGEGGGYVGMPIDVTLGGTRTTGTASIAVGGAVTFTADNE